MIGDGPGDPEDVEFIKEITTITNDRIAELFLGMSCHSAALAVHLYGKFEIVVNHYFVEQSILPCPADFENEALRFAIWMYMAQGLDDGDNSSEKEKEQKKESKEMGLTDNGGKSGDESEGLYDA